MALTSNSASTPKGIVITVPGLVLAVSVAAIFLFFLLSSLSSYSCPCNSSPESGSSAVRVPVSPASEGRVSVSTSREDVEWVKDQIRLNGLHMQDNVLRKGINPRTRAQQLQDLSQSVHSLSLSLSLPFSLFLYVYVFYVVCMSVCKWVFVLFSCKCEFKCQVSKFVYSCDMGMWQFLFINPCVFLFFGLLNATLFIWF